MTQLEKNQVNRAATSVGGLTLLSRILGFIRDVATATFLGAGYFSDAFFVAFRIPNLFRRLFGEGALTVAFVPIFTRVHVREGEEEAKKFFNATSAYLFLALLVVVIAGEIFARPLAWLFAAGFDDEKLALTVDLLQILFPYIMLISLVALSMGVLNSLKHFVTPALSPCLLNLAMIASLAVSPFVSWHPVWCLAVGVIVGGVLQLAVQIVPLKKRGFLPRPKFDKSNTHVRELLKMMFPAVFGAAAYQLNLLINTQLASRLPEGSVSYLYYADRLVEFPMGVVAVALGTAILPFLSQQAANEDFSKLKETLKDGLKTLYFFIFPALAGLFLLRMPLIQLFFERRAFDAEDAEKTAFALSFSVLGLIGAGALKVVLPTFYAMKDMWTPFKMSLVAIGVNLGLALWLMKPLLHGGLALAVSVSAFVNASLLMFFLRLKIGRLGLKDILGSLVKMSFCTVFMAGVVHSLGEAIGVYAPASGGMKALQVLAVISAGFLSYLWLSRALKVDGVEIFENVFDKLTRKRASSS